ncbi:MAG: hypothetical protein CMJ78_00620 [Planctomycetaceae bacterium]|nr:hypothetical protein [Planctomycetaceae bacterium]
MNDELLYQLVIGTNPELAAVHRMTGSLDDILHTRDDDTTIHSWLKYYRRSLERDGFTSETDYETKHFADTETLDNFANVNGESIAIHSACGLTLVETQEFNSHQDACSSIEGCTGWWRFTRIGYNQTQTQAVLHTDYDDPKYGLMGMGHFVLLEQLKGQWSVVAKNMTWIS